MKLGTLYGIGIGPGDPELITVKGAKILKRCRRIFVPRPQMHSDSLALSIAKRYVNAKSQIYTIIFPMTKDPSELRQHWRLSAEKVASVLETGEDACFLTLGDSLLYSTYIYLLRALRGRLPGVNIVTVPGITAFSAAAALTEFPIGEGKQPVTIVPAADDVEDVRRALAAGGTIVLMKIGQRLAKILDLLEEFGLIEHSVLVSRAGLADERIETDLRGLDRKDPELGYLSVILVHAQCRKLGEGDIFR